MQKSPILGLSLLTSIEASDQRSFFRLPTFPHVATVRNLSLSQTV